MSGVGFGYILAAPIVIGGAAVAGTGMAAYGVAKAGVHAGKAVYSYYKKKEEEREEIKRSGIRSDLGLLHAGVEETFASMDRMERQLSQDMEKEMLSRNDELQEVLRRADAPGCAGRSRKRFRRWKRSAGSSIGNMRGRSERNWMRSGRM